MALNASGGTPVSPGALAFFSFLTALLNSPQVIGSLSSHMVRFLRDLGKDSGISGSFGIIHSVKVRGKHRHVFRCIGSTRAVWKTHRHCGFLFMVSRFTFCEKADVLPREARIHAHVVDLGADVGIPCGFGMRYCMRNVAVKSF